LYAYLCVFAHSRFVENPPIGSWETNPLFLRWFCYNYLTMMRPHIIAWHETKLANVHCQHSLILTESISTSAAWSLHTLIESSSECTINKFSSLVHPFSCVSPSFLLTIVQPPTTLINHSRGKIFI
jgi:hypothetical protein